jgi:hypothetical protein
LVRCLAHWLALGSRVVRFAGWLMGWWVRDLVCEARAGGVFGGSVARRRRLGGLLHRGLGGPGCRGIGAWGVGAALGDSPTDPPTRRPNDRAPTQQPTKPPPHTQQRTQKPIMPTHPLGHQPTKLITTSNWPTRHRQPINPTNPPTQQATKPPTQQRTNPFVHNSVSS